MKNTTFASDLGPLTERISPEGDSFFQGTYKLANGDGMFFSIKNSKTPKSNNETKVFAATALSEFSKHLNNSINYINQLLRTSPELLGVASNFCPPDELIGEPEATFWGDGHWSILFSECALPIGEPYGILINFIGDKISGIENISTADEI
ncbi:hypothetical protein [Pseudomonas fluorescens]